MHVWNSLIVQYVGTYLVVFLAISLFGYIERRKFVKEMVTSYFKAEYPVLLLFLLFCHIPHRERKKRNQERRRVAEEEEEGKKKEVEEGGGCCCSLPSPESASFHQGKRWEGRRERERERKREREVNRQASSLKIPTYSFCVAAKKWDQGLLKKKKLIFFALHRLHRYVEKDKHFSYDIVLALLSCLIEDPRIQHTVDEHCSLPLRFLSLSSNSNMKEDSQSEIAWRKGGKGRQRVRERMETR